MNDRFFLYQRKNSPNWYVRYKLSNGLYSSGRSVFTTDRSEAEYKVLRWLHDNVSFTASTENSTSKNDLLINEAIEILKRVTLKESDANRILDIFRLRGVFEGFTVAKRQSVKIIDFLYEFWDYEKSVYVQDKLNHGHKIGLRRCKEATASIKRHWEPYFKDKTFDEVTRLDMQDFSLFLSNKKKVDKKGKPTSENLSPASLNRILGYGTVATAWAVKQDMIKSDPCGGLMKFSGKTKRRGILSDKEVEKLFTKGDWQNNEGARLGNLLASQTGMRAGEIIALQIRDILDDRIHVIHSYSRDEGGLKSTKTGEERFIPILPETRELLIEYAKQNPEGYNPDSFIFYSPERRGIPQGRGYMLKYLRLALESIEIKPEEQKARNITFHGWRHYYARKMADVLGERAAKLTGHATQEMLEHYANHANEEDFQKAAEATAEVFGRVIPFHSLEVAQ